ncbi:MAG: hypothetical protein PV358_17935, partial [Acidimicrobiales bacterium]|nr:hypothetical protein [Acidimicrobiales bacterium]
IDDRDVRSVDLLPTLADMIGVEVPWPVDGEVIGTADRDGTTKPFVPTDQDDWHATEGERFIEVDARAGFDRVLAADPVPWEGEDAVWKRTAHGDLVGRDVADLAVGDAATEPVALAATGLGDVDLDEPLPIEVVGTTRLSGGTDVAIALNGTVGAVADVEALPPGRVPAGSPPQRIAGLLLPRLFVEGDNDVEVFAVAGPVGGEVLHPVPLT